MRCILWNVEGLKSTIALSPPHLELAKFDVILLTETFDTKGVEIHGFTCFSINAKKPGGGRPQGGVTIGVNQRLRVRATLVDTGKNIMVVKIREINLYFILAYFKPLTPVEEILLQITDSFKKVSARTNCVLAGDFNCRMDGDNPRGAFLADSLTALGFTVTNEADRFTYICRNGQSTIDLFFCNNDQITSNHEVEVSHITKHQPVITEYTIPHAKNEKRQTSIWKCDLHKLENYVKEWNFHESTDPDVIFEMFAKAIRDSELTRLERKSKVWFDGECYRAHQKLKELYKVRNTDSESYHNVSRRNVRKKLRLNKKF